MLHILADKDTQVAAIVIRVDAGVIVTIVALVAANGGRIGYAIMHRVYIHGATIARAEQHRDDARRSKARYISQDVFSSIVLVMSWRVIHGIKILVAHRHLPHYYTSMGVPADITDEGEIAREIREGLIVAIPPGAPRQAAPSLRIQEPVEHLQRELVALEGRHHVGAGHAMAQRRASPAGYVY